MRPDQMPRQPDGELAGLPAVQRWHATGDYAYPAEEREDGEFVAYDDHRAELLRLANENADYGKHAIEQYKRGVYWMDRAKEAEAELAALKARIADADKCYAFEDFCNLANGQVDRTRRFASIRTALPESMIGQNFALVPLDDAEAKG